MNTVRAAVATKSGNPLCDKSHAELTLRVIQPASEMGICGFPKRDSEVAA
jgi:hypothetical protein